VARISSKVQLVGDCTDEEMNSRRFYLTLPSNASMNLFPDNTAAQYTIKLPRPITLDGGDWEVALTELSVPAIFDNIKDNTCFVQLIGPDDTIDRPTMIFTIDGGYYTLDTMIRYLNQRLSPRGITVKMLNGAVLLRNNGTYRAHINDVLLEKLGLTNMPAMGFPRGRFSGVPRNEISGETVPTLFIYCDILEHVIVGDVMAPLLRMVDMKRRETYGKMHETPHAPLYVPVQKKHFDTIEINIMTDTGVPVHFAAGKTVTVLEFKRLGLLDKVV